MRCVWFAACAFLVVATAASAQETGATPEPSPHEANPSEPPPPKFQGDVVRLKGGMVLEGVQVLRSSPKEIQIEVAPGTPPLVIPRRQVESVTYDDIDPLRERRRRERQPAKDHSGEISASELNLSPELNAKLQTNIPVPINYPEGDFIHIFEILSKLAHLDIVIDESVRKLPAEQRLWAPRAPANTKLETFLREGFLKKFPNLDLVYQFDKILITTKPAHEKGTLPPPEKEGS